MLLVCALPCVELLCITLHSVVYCTALPCIVSHRVTLHQIILHGILLPCMAWQHVALHHNMHLCTFG